MLAGRERGVRREREMMRNTLTSAAKANSSAINFPARGLVQVEAGRGWVGLLRF